MELRSLAVFVSVAELANLSKAAIALGLTQPSLSRMMAKLEAELGGALFHRTGRGVTLTELGQAALPRARSLCLNGDQLVADMRDLARSPSGVVAVALLPSFVPQIAGGLVQETRDRFPGIRLRILEGFSGQIDEWLSNGTADLALLARYRSTPGTGEELIHSAPLVLIARRGGSRRIQRIRFTELAGLPLVLPAMPNGLRLAVEDAARKNAIRLNVVAEADSLEAQKDIVLRGGCYAVLGPRGFTPDIQGQLLQTVPITDPELPRITVLASTRQRPLSRASREIARVLRKVARATQVN